MDETLFNDLNQMKQTEEDILRNIGYSDKALSMLAKHLNFGEMDNPDITLKYQSSCSDVLILYLKYDKERILDAKYEYIGCIGLEAAASALTEMIKGKTLQDALKINFQDVLSFLEGIPQSKYECIHLALTTLKEGIKIYENK